VHEPPDLSPVTALAERQRSEGLHDGAQLYVSLRGQPLLDVAIGESRPGVPLRRDDLMLWYSSGKPVTTVAVLQLWERGLLGLDDPVGRFLPAWGGGKERVTLRHVLTHTGGFTMLPKAEPFDSDLPYDEVIARIAAHPLEWEPGTRAGYHPSTGWKVLGAVIEAVDGRPVDRYVTEEVLRPAAMTECRMGIPVDEQAALGDRLVPVAWKGYVVAIPTRDGIHMVEYHVERIHNEPWHIAKVEPGGGMRGPARQLGRFYECLLGYGPQLLEPRTVEMMSGVHRHGLRVPWGLGVQVAAGMSGGPGRRAFGHSGMGSSRGLADPDVGLVMVFVTNGLPDPLRNERRMVQITDAVYSALGDEAARFRLPVRPGADSVPG
jgi:CubicO group peptidase (beta-lactamase class C family)